MKIFQLAIEETSHLSHDANRSQKCIERFTTLGPEAVAAPETRNASLSPPRLFEARPKRRLPSRMCSPGSDISDVWQSTRFNLCGAAQAAMVRDFCDRWRRFTETYEYRKFRAVWSHVCVAATCVPDHDHFWDRAGTRLVRRAEWIAHRIAEDKQNWYTLEASEQNLWTNMDELRTKLHDLLRTPPGVRHARAGSGMANM